MIGKSIQTNGNGTESRLQNATCDGGDMENVRKTVVREFMEMMSLSPDDGFYWTGTISDLVELTHIVWESGAFIDDSGRPMAFTKMVHHIFYILHAREPKRPTVVMNNVNSRKNVRTIPLMERYRMLMESGKCCKLMGNSVRRQAKCVQKGAVRQSVMDGIANNIV